MFQFAVSAAVGMVMVFLAASYVWLTWQRKYSPIPITWLILLVMTGLSFFTYMQSGKPWWENIGVSAGVLTMAINFFGLSFVYAAQGRLKEMFPVLRRDQLASLLGAAFFTGLYFWTQNAFISYLAIQVIGLLAYIPTFRVLRAQAKLERPRPSSEPLWIWRAILACNLAAIIPGILNPYSWIFIARTVFSMGMTIRFIGQIQAKNKKLQAVAIARG